MSLTRHIKNTQAAIKAWAKVNPNAVSHELLSFREECYPLPVPPSCGSPGCFGGHLPYFAHFYKLGVRSLPDGDGEPFLKRWPNLSNQELSAHLFGNRYLFAPQRPSERGTAHEAVTARLRANLAQLMAV